MKTFPALSFSHNVCSVFSSELAESFPTFSQTLSLHLFFPFTSETPPYTATSSVGSTLNSKYNSLP
uniref:Uncharacterized protein n=1 Tax=Octopus bimaculoides TaxID=37653 RepID=A0A0L8FY66_OCTBM